MFSPTALIDLANAASTPVYVADTARMIVVRGAAEVVGLEYEAARLDDIQRTIDARLAAEQESKARASGELMCLCGGSHLMKDHYARPAG